MNIEQKAREICDRLILDSFNEQTDEFSAELAEPIIAAALQSAVEEEREEIDRLANALDKVMEHVYCQNDYTIRDYDNYYAAVEQAKAALAVHRARGQKETA